MDDKTPRKGMADPQLDRAAFLTRFKTQFADPVFMTLSDAVDQIALALCEAVSRNAAGESLEIGREIRNPRPK